MSPDNGHTYSPIELEAIMAITVDPMVAIVGDDAPLARQWEFHAHAATLDLPDKARDSWARNILTKAILAEVENPEPTDMYWDPYIR